MRIIFYLLVAVTVSSCSGFQEFYKPYTDAFKLKDVELLQHGEYPKVYSTNKFEEDRKSIISDGYRPIGFASFNGKYDGDTNLIAQAESVGATLVLVSRKYTNTRSTTSQYYMPTTSTTYHSGTVNSNSNYNSSSGRYLGSSSSSGNYSGTSTTQSGTFVPITSSHRRYDQMAMFFVKSTKKLRFGVQLKDISIKLRDEIERNTGAVIVIVFKGSPAFNANILPNDVLIKINDTQVNNRAQGSGLLKKVPLSDKSALLTVIRKGKEKVIKVIF